MSEVSNEAEHLVILIVNEEDQEKSETLKDYWIKLGTQLEIDGVPKEDIRKTAEDLILNQRAIKTGIPREELSMGRWFYQVYSENDWVNHDLGRPKNLENQETIAETTKENSFPFALENDDTIQLLIRLKEWASEAITLFKNNPFESIVPKDEMNETKLLVSRAIDHAHENLNNKTMIPHSNYPILFREFIGAVGGGISTSYYQHCKKKSDFSAKYASKLARGLVKDMPLRYNPLDEDEAEACGYSGLPCPKCNDWKTELSSRVTMVEVIDSKGKPQRQHKAIKQIFCYQCKSNSDAPRSDLIPALINDGGFA